ncbi:MAG: 5'-methylthioadenosine/adenosylhomocysteine nucleosidase [Christensenellaceae bacterium]|jgi:adenosylhomocysteine nucleosidase|nr:5'-methylthioadenosine/adenosylhomocysteine nucleosidase [Christensenellaceae bacterium]
MRYGILTAMPSEFSLLRGALKGARSETILGVEYFTGMIGRHEVILAICGIGKVNAALRAQTMLLRFAPDALINVGVAGGCAPGLRPLDLILADRVCQHDVDTTPLGDAPGFVSTVNTVFFHADEALLKGLARAGEALELNPIVATVASGDQFVASAEKKAELCRVFGASAAEMEAGAIAQAAYVAGLPFAVIRSISDSDTEGNARMEFETFVQLAADRAAGLLLRFFGEK